MGQALQISSDFEMNFEGQKQCQQLHFRLMHELGAFFLKHYAPSRVKTLCFIRKKVIKKKKNFSPTGNCF
jgi:hypothetical protein